MTESQDDTIGSCLTAGWKRRWPVALVGAGLLAGLLGGCGGEDDPCKFMANKATPAGTGQYLIGIDRTADQMPLGLPRALLADIGAQARTHTFSVGMVQGDAAPDRFWLSSVRGLQPAQRAEDSSNQDAQGKRLAECVENRLPQVRASTPGTDDLAAMRSLAASLGPAKDRGDARMALVSNGMSNTGELDLRQAVATDQTAASVVTSIATGPGIPDLSRITVTFYHLGLMDRSRDQLSPARTLWLHEVYLGICNAGHAAGCFVSDDTGDKVSKVPAPTDPEFGDTGVDPSPTWIDPCRPTLPAEELFQPGEARLAQHADDRLKPLADQLRASGETAEINGYTATWGTKAYRADLSQRRADAVRTRLISLGVPAQLLTAHGRGSTNPVVDDTDAGGTLIDDLAPRNRRIEIIFGGHCG